MSYKRLGVNIPEKQWHYVGISREISDLVDQFISSADTSVLHSKMIEIKGYFKNNSIWKLVPNFSSLPVK